MIPDRQRRPERQPARSIYQNGVQELSEHQRRKPAGKQPISRHPLFPAIVALWFGALFGLGSLLVHPEIIERAVVAAHIDSVIPMAAPPLGTTTRILLALAMTGIGGLLGALLGRRLARPPVEHRERRRQTRPVDSERRTVTSGRSFLGSPADEPDSSVAHTGRRRTLALQENGLPRESQEYAPLPGVAPQILDLSELEFDDDGDARDVAAHTEAVLDEVASETGFDAPTIEPGFAPVEPLAQRAPHTVQMFVPEPVDDISDDQMIDSEAGAFDSPVPAFTAAVPGAMRLFESYSGSITAKPEQASACADSESLLSRAFEAPATAQTPTVAETESNAIDADKPAASSLVTESALADEAVPDAAEMPRPPIDATAAERIASSELGQLSHVELLERLAIAMEERRLQAQAAQIVVKPVAEIEHPLAPTEAEAAPQASLRESVVPGDPAEPVDLPGEAVAPPPFTRLPAALRPVSLDHDDDDALPGYIPPRHIGTAPVQPTAPASALFTQEAEDEGENGDDEPVDDDSVLQEGYSSLLGLSLPAPSRPSFVRIDAPEPDEVQPVVIFPGEAIAGNAEAPFGRPAQTAVQALPPVPPIASSGNGERRFDPPGSAQPSAASARPDSEDTERALRAALATLQRMSGAA